MSERVEPALTPEEWAQRKTWTREPAWLEPSATQGFVEFNVNEVGVTPYVLNAVEVMALANAALPDDDPRKITRHTLWIIRTLRDDAYIDPQHPGAMRFKREVEQLLAALESLLPPDAGGGAGGDDLPSGPSGIMENPGFERTDAPNWRD